MTAPHATAAASPAGPGTRSSSDGSGSDDSGPDGSGSQVTRISVLLYSDDRTVRDAVRVDVGRRPARDVEVESWRECATAAAVIAAVEGGSFDVLILDGEATPTGGLGLCRQLKSEIFGCPPVLVLIGRPHDRWLATWSLADAVVSHPLDPIALADAVAELGRRGRPAND